MVPSHIRASLFLSPLIILVERTLAGTLIRLWLSIDIRAVTTEVLWLRICRKARLRLLLVCLRKSKLLIARVASSNGLRIIELLRDSVAIRSLFSLIAILILIGSIVGFSLIGLK